MVAADPPQEKKKEAPAAPAQDLSRYPDHLPEWLWQDQRRSAQISTSLRKELEADLKILTILDTLSDKKAYETKHTEVRRKLHAAFTLRDLTAGGHLVTDDRSRLALSVQVDPTFDAAATDTIRKAAGLFLKVAVDPQVVKDAVETSIDRPEPMPAQFEMKDGKPLKDEFGNNVYTEDYKFFLSERYRPHSADAFLAQMTSVLKPGTGDPALLIVTSYTGGKWWGAGRVKYSVLPDYQLTAEVPASPYLYIALRSERLTANSPDGGDPAFWAGKIAHEVLHNLGYAHPGYKDLADRDANNPAGRKSFLIAYEQAVTVRAKNLQK